MSESWKELDLEGGGLQTVNKTLAARLRRRPVGYVLWLFFPMGLHRFYLHEPRGGAAYIGLTALTAVLAALLSGPAAWIGAAALVAFALFDLFWIDRRVTDLNKRIRVGTYLGGGATPPTGYKGRYTDDDESSLLGDYLREKEQERGGHQPANMRADGGDRQRAPSFHEQEQMLREMNRRRREGGETSLPTDAGTGHRGGDGGDDGGD